MSTESIMPSNRLILCCPLSSYPQSFLALGSFPMSQLFASGGPDIGASASASALPMNIQGWFPLGVTSWISLLSKGLSRVFSSTTVRKHQFFGTQPSLWFNSHIYTWCWPFGRRSGFLLHGSLFRATVWVKSLSRVRLFATPWTVARQASLSMGFSRQEYWSGLPFPSPGYLPNPRIEPGSPPLQADALSSEPPGKVLVMYNPYLKLGEAEDDHYRFRNTRNVCNHVSEWEGEHYGRLLASIECPFEICGRRLMVKSVSTVYFFPLMLSCLDSFGVIQSWD